MTIMQNRIRDNMVGMVTEAGIPKSKMLPGMAVQIYSTHRTIICFALGLSRTRKKSSC